MRPPGYSSKDDHLSTIGDIGSALVINSEHDRPLTRPIIFVPAYDYYKTSRWALFKQARYNETIEAYANAITDAYYYSSRALAYLSSSDRLSPIEDAQSALEIKSRRDMGYHRLGRALFDEERYDEAIEPYTNAIGLDSTDPDYYSERAQAYSRNEDHLSAMNDAQSSQSISNMISDTTS